jgi:hypothetical protein
MRNEQWDSRMRERLSTASWTAAIDSDQRTPIGAAAMTQLTGSQATGISVGSWVYSRAHGAPVRLLDVETLWNHTVCQVWVPRKNTVGSAWAVRQHASI